MSISYRLPPEALRRSWGSTLIRIALAAPIAAAIFWFLLALLSQVLASLDVTVRVALTAVGTGLLVLRVGINARIMVRQFAEHYALTVDGAALTRSSPPLPDVTLREDEIVRVAEHPRLGVMLQAADGRRLRLSKGLAPLEEISSSLAARPREAWDRGDRRAILRERQELQRAMKKEGRLKRTPGYRAVEIAVWVGVFLFLYSYFSRKNQLPADHGPAVEQEWYDATHRAGP